MEPWSVGRSCTVSRGRNPPGACAILTSMLLSHRCTYGLRLALHLARQSGGFVPIGRVAEALGMPSAFLSKTAQDLSHAGLLTTKRGPGGGVALARPLDAITLEDVVLATDGPEIFSACVLGLPGCGSLAPCPLHDEWVSARARIREVFASTSLAALATSGGERLAWPSGE